MGERDEVWQHGENLFPGFKCMYCLKKISRGRSHKVEGAFGGEM
jgi:hypothetical protein